MAGNWRERYADKVVAADFAVQKIKPGDRVFIGSGCGEPQALVQALTQAADRLADVEVIQALPLGPAPYAHARYAASFRPNTLFIGPGLRDAVNETRADYTPLFLSQVPRLFRSRDLGLDVALITVTPPDEHGLCSLGVSVDVTKAAAESARCLIAQVNPQMPYVLGDCFLHVNQITWLVDHDAPLLEMPPLEEPSDVTQEIASHVSRLVPDGATLQVGIGRIPDAILTNLTARYDLGIHSDVITDGVMMLARAGVVTGKQKTLNRGKIVGSLAAGTRELFQFLHENPQVEFYLSGQVSVDSVGRQLQGGFSGRVDFIRGAAMAREGKPIVVLPSTMETPEGAQSRIRATLDEGAGVFTTRGDAHYIVTEYGIAYLHGRSIRERAMSLISIAHPDHRGDLLHAAKRRRIVFANQIMPPPRQPYPEKYETTVTLRDGSQVLIRPIRSDDETRIKDMFYSFSEQTVYLRFHSVLKALPHNRLQVFCNVDYDTEMALVAAVGNPGDEDIIATGRFLADPSKTSAEMAFAVRDDWQRKGLGTLLFDRLIEIGRASGIRKFAADVLIENSGMLKIFHRSGLNIETSTEAGVVHVLMTPPEKKVSR
jgi:acyl-CoA hydrolase/GNAT superfamily N-acetyltransferase